MRFIISLMMTLTLGAVEISPEVRPIATRLETALGDAERAFHQAQAKAKEDALRDLEKLLRAEQRKKNSLISADLEIRIAALIKDIALLKDEPLLKATDLNSKISKMELTEDEWSAVPAQIIKLDAKDSRGNTKIKIGVGELYFIVPHPTDTWKSQPTSESLTWAGNGHREMKLMIRCGEREISGLFVSEVGPLTLGPNDKVCSDNEGSLRVKILRVH